MYDWPGLFLACWLSFTILFNSDGYLSCRWCSLDFDQHKYFHCCLLCFSQLRSCFLHLLRFASDSVASKNIVQALNFESVVVNSIASISSLTMLNPPNNKNCHIFVVNYQQKQYFLSQNVQITRVTPMTMTSFNQIKSHQQTKVFPVVGRHLFCSSRSSSCCVTMLASESN